MWRIYRAAGRSWPRLSPDDVIDYMVMEAVALKAQAEDDELAKSREKKQWQGDFSELDKFR